MNTAIEAFKAYGLPADFFEVEPPGSTFLNPLELMEQVSIKPPAVEGLSAGLDPCPKNLGLYMYNPVTGKSMTLPCKKRSCEVCGKGWARNWRNRLNWNEFFHFRDDKALTLTSAYDAGYKKFWLALKEFWRNLRNYCQVRPEILDKKTGEYRPKLYYKVGTKTGIRKWMELRTKKLVPGGETFRIIRPFRKVEYFGVVEYNQKKTQPHFHFVLRCDYIPQIIVRKCWEKAQKAANFEKIAFDVRIEKIKETVKQYFFKYITKLVGGKDELPPPEKWSGRGVRYSKEFFAAKAPVQKSAISLSRQAKNDDFSKFVPIFSRNRLVLEQKLEIDQFQAEMESWTAGDWNPDRDIMQASIPGMFKPEKFVNFSWDIILAIGDNSQNFSLKPGGSKKIEQSAQSRHV